MNNAFFEIPIPINEPVKEYTPGSQEREELLSEYKKMYNSKIDIPMYIGDEKIFTNDKRK